MYFHYEKCQHNLKDALKYLQGNTNSDKKRMLLLLRLTDVQLTDIIAVRLIDIVFSFLQDCGMYCM